MAKSETAMTRAKAREARGQEGLVGVFADTGRRLILGRRERIEMDVADDGEPTVLASRPRRQAGHAENDEDAQANEECCRSCHAKGVP